MKRPVIKTKAGQYTFLQVLSLAVSGIAYMLGSMVTAVIMLGVATIFGVLVMVMRLKEAQEIKRQQGYRRRR